MFFKTNCKSINTYISALIDGELKGRKADKVKNHLEACKRCRQEFEIVSALKPITKKVRIEKAPLYLKSRIINSIEESEKKWSFIDIFSAWNLKPVYTTLAIASVLILAIAPLYYFSANVSASSIIVKSVNNHLSNTIVDIFDEQMPSSKTELERIFDVQGLSWQGISSPKVNLHYLKERRVAYIAFDRKGHKLSLFIFDVNNLKLPDGRIIKEGEKEIYVDKYKGFNVLFWKEGNVGYSMVSDLGGDEMIHFLKYGEGYINQIQKNIELGILFE